MAKCLVNGLLPEHANRIFVFLVLFLKFERSTYHRVFFVYVSKAPSQVSTKIRPHIAIWLLPKIILFISSLSAKGFVVCFYILATRIRLIRLGTRGAPRSWHLGIPSSLPSEQGLGIPSQQQKACGSSAYQEADIAKQDAGSFLRGKNPGGTLSFASCKCPPAQSWSWAQLSYSEGLSFCINTYQHLSSEKIVQGPE